VALVCLGPWAARADHAITFFPSFYPQEIRIEQFDPDAAAREFANKTDPLHAYLGAAPRFRGAPPEHLKSVESLKTLIVASVNPQSQRMRSREGRCRASAQAVPALAKRPDLVAHAYPVTPYHADHIHHVDLASRANAQALHPGADPTLKFRATSGGPQGLLAEDAHLSATDWDLELLEISPESLMRMAGIGFNAWPVPPWAKDGWFQAYHLLRPALTEAESRERADAIFHRLTHGAFKDLTEQINLERDLLETLTRGCERTVLGYRLRTEFYNDDFSNGIENIVADAQFGFNSPVFLRTVKLKDFLWNGWLRLGMEERPVAAWNPVAGFTDTAGRLIWRTVADDAFLPIPYNSRWAANRTQTQPAGEAAARRSLRMPPDALVPEPRTGKLDAVGAERGAAAMVRYRVLASPYQDETAMDTADLLYPFALAFRWGAEENRNVTFDPAISAATRLMRERLRGVKIVKVEETKLRDGEVTFTHRSVIVEVYLDNPAPDEQERAVIAPPWSAAPWHLLALMEAAVERGIAAFSESEAKRRGLPWLDLVRDPAQLEKLRALIREFANTGYRPAALKALVSAESATSRWQRLDKFVTEKGHLLVTNGPYRLKSWSASSMVFDVVREFTYPVGLGTFDLYAYPPRALITAFERAADRVVLSVDVELARKEQRNRRLVRVPLRRDTLRGTLPIQPMLRYVAIGANGRVAGTGGATRLSDERFALALPPKLPTGTYSIYAAMFLDGNTIKPEIGRVSYKSD
jgi:hypothetical protein